MNSSSPVSETEEYRYARNLLVHFVEEHFPHNPDWKPLPDLLGVLTQLDNAITIARDYKERLRGLAQTPTNRELHDAIASALRQHGLTYSGIQEAVRSIQKLYGPSDTSTDR